VTKTVGLEEFQELCAREQDARYELDEGELVPLSPTSRKHAAQIDKIYRFLIQRLPAAKYDILPGEVGFVLGSDPKPIVRGADLAVLPHQENPNEGFIAEAPLLAVEVISPGNTAEDTERKREQYLAHGTGEVWMVYPKSQTIHVYRQASSPDLPAYTVCDRSGQFHSLLGFSVPCAQLFS
jgi:Uma2 family endonuclease